jgi:ribosomal protein L37AE/L43A
MVRAWSLLTIDEDDRQFGGNLGYEDILGERYLWNSTVPNSRMVQAGDLALLRNGRWVLGLAWIDEIAIGRGKKVRRRCPACGSTAFKPRKQRTPFFKCSPCKAEFDSPALETIDVTMFESDYARTWRSLDIVIPVSEIRLLYLNNSHQQSIREMDFEGVRRLLSVSAGLGSRWGEEDGGLRPSIIGGHKLTFQRTRMGQAQFRRYMLDRYDSQCALTGPQPPETLEAAHLYRYADTALHDISGGLLFRRDLHALFDRWLLAIDTTAWTARISPRLHQYAHLAALDGEPLHVPAHLRPKASYLDEHFEIASNCWEGITGLRRA